MSDNTNLENRFVEAIRHYRAALALAENLEREGACARRSLANTLIDLARAVDDEAAPSLKESLFEIRSTAASRSDEALAALSEATARLEYARLTVAALEQQLGYIPEVPTEAGDSA
ncbi:hypothetical protein [Bradyrhizobium sp. ERR14]|uniref:hypothetical protein n=1 Tax=Bradyrhizobium sp. ERR14 TaxID=2663837 RepID=UPI00161CA478|nr:hypothetical protein [Bradyrhizobium sp. ERR14]MBB4398870.1 hypothetical protein [Bradyrhizobium sp. ERR14]